MNETLGWWFGTRDEDGEVRLPHGDGRIVRAGETLSVEGEIKPCHRGLHASERAIDALGYSPLQGRSVIFRVALSGTVIPHGNPVDKVVASHRRVLWMADADTALRRFAVEVALSALLLERHYGREPDPRSFDALVTAMRFVEGKATKEELRAAYAAADAADAAADAAAAAAYADAAADAAVDAAAYAADAAADAAAYAAAADAADRWKIRFQVRAFKRSLNNAALERHLNALAPDTKATTQGAQGDER